VKPVTRFEINRFHHPLSGTFHPKSSSPPLAAAFSIATPACLVIAAAYRILTLA
jgi:hypothetical protein